MMEKGRKRNENRMFPKSLNSSCEQYQRKKAKEERKKKKWGEKTLNFINNPPSSLNTLSTICIKTLSCINSTRTPTSTIGLVVWLVN